MQRVSPLDGVAHTLRLDGIVLIIPLLIGTVAVLGPDADTSQASHPIADTAAVLAPALRAASSDTVPRPRPRAVDVSDAYELRLRIHRYASYTMIPLFALQTIAGNQLYQSGGSDPSWAKSLHSAGAAGLGTLFTLNTVTGVWNLWDSRDQAQGRGVRLLHSALMLLSDGGFAYAGIKLAPEAEKSLDKRNEHRRVAYISMGTALAGYAVMLFAPH